MRRIQRAIINTHLSSLFNDPTTSSSQAASLPSHYTSLLSSCIVFLLSWSALGRLAQSAIPTGVVDLYVGNEHVGCSFPKMCCSKRHIQQLNSTIKQTSPFLLLLPRSLLICYVYCVCRPETHRSNNMSIHRRHCDGHPPLHLSPTGSPRHPCRRLDPLHCSSPCLNPLHQRNIL